MKKLNMFVGLVCLLNLSAYGQYGGGSGSADDPFIIAEPNHMQAIGVHQEHWAKHFRLGRDIDLSQFTGDDFNTIGAVLNNPIGIALDVGGGKMYWTDISLNMIRRANLDGSEIEDLITTGLGSPFGIALDLLQNKMYWTDYETKKIQRANLDGSNVEDLVTDNLGSPRGIALDVYGNQMYWVDSFHQRIQRAYMNDGSGVQDLVTIGLNSPQGIALDVDEGKMYWTDMHNSKIWRASLNGSDVEELVSLEIGSSNMEGIALDVTGGKMYWTDYDTDKIQRANLDGSNIEDIISRGLFSPSGIALDANEGKMYWTDRQSYKIQRANLDGSGGEDIVQNYFTGVFDGNHRVIHNFSYISVDTACTGIFGYVDGINTEIKNLGLSNVNIQRGHYVGALVGNLISGTLSNCYVSGNVTGNYYTGMLVGINSSGTLIDCYATGSVEGAYTTGGLTGYNAGSLFYCYTTGFVIGTENVGGLTGENYGQIINSNSASRVNGLTKVGGLAGINNDQIINCYATGNVEGFNKSQCFSGGLVGYNDRGYIARSYTFGNVGGNRITGGLVGVNSGTVINCLSVGNVSNSGSGNDSYSGGLVGNNDKGSIAFCYSKGNVAGGYFAGGLIGANSYGSIEHSFWDMQTSGITISAGGVGKNTEEMQQRNTYMAAGWDFIGEINNGGEDIWGLVEGESYPQLITLYHYGGGSGTRENPYLIFNMVDMQFITAKPNSHFRLMTDLDMTGIDYPEWAIIGRYPDHPFTGVFDGNYHTITNLTLNTVASDFVGLFGYIEGAEARVKNLHLENINLHAGTGDYIGAVVGYNANGMVMDCSATGMVAGRDFVGGLIGVNEEGILEDCYATVTTAGLWSVGGLLGYNNGLINRCYATGFVEGEEKVGGLVGYNYKNTVTNCYSTGYVEGDFHIGGLMGYNFKGQISYCFTTADVWGYFDVGAMVGREFSGSYIASFWDETLSPGLPGIGNIVDPNMVGESTENLMKLNTLTNAGWDFNNETDNGEDNIWRMCVDEINYPKLSWQFLKGDLVCPDGVNILDLAYWMNHWLEDNCFTPNYCNRADLDNSGHVDLFDYSMLAANWMKGVIH